MTPGSKSPGAMTWHTSGKRSYGERGAHVMGPGWKTRRISAFCPPRTGIPIVPGLDHVWWTVPSHKPANNLQHIQEDEPDRKAGGDTEIRYLHFLLLTSGYETVLVMRM
jgi:hypothetical protein